MVYTQTTLDISNAGIGMGEWARRRMRSYGGMAKLSVPGRPIIWQGPIALAEGGGRRCLDIFLLTISSFFLSPTQETACNRLKYCL